MPGFEDLPSEINAAIVSRLERKDLKQLRLVSYKYHGYASRLLFRRLAITSNPSSCPSMTALLESTAQSRISFAHYVHSMVLHNHTNDPDILARFAAALPNVNSWEVTVSVLSQLNDLFHRQTPTGTPGLLMQFHPKLLVLLRKMFAGASQFHVGFDRMWTKFDRVHSAAIVTLLPANLTNLDMKSPNQKDTTVSVSLFDQLSIACPAMEELRVMLSHDPDTTDGLIQQLAENANGTASTPIQPWPTMHSLNITVIGFDSFGALFAYIGFKMPCLSSLSVRCPEEQFVGQQYIQLPNALVSCLRHCLPLRCLDAFTCLSIQRLSSNDFIWPCLPVSWKQSLQLRGVNQLFTSQPKLNTSHLRNLDLCILDADLDKNLPPIDLVCFLDYLPNLLSLSLKLADRTGRLEFRVSDWFIQQHPLETLSLSIFNCESNLDLERFALMCPNLTSICLADSIFRRNAAPAFIHNAYFSALTSMRQFPRENTCVYSFANTCLTDVSIGSYRRGDGNFACHVVIQDEIYAVGPPVRVFVFDASLPNHGCSELDASETEWFLDSLLDNDSRLHADLRGSTNLAKQALQQFRFDNTFVLHCRSIASLKCYPTTLF
ncbi:hypothetical protein DM01DRAFT_1403663 [Hesseltinella vesiculosa]|uniref:F-box domain-containing protein n=1 Tax=Hesseltinella vesiculosa TaxID=101127 RepID=A0A1X2GV70_9FUNG|nr:hypothetical protein DM01DRAFT_1403663 [Hesseltinella vesiculosa]